MSARPAPASPVLAPRDRARRQPLGFVRYSADASAPSSATSAEIDWTAWYLTEEDDMPQTVTQGVLCARVKSRFDVLQRRRPDLQHKTFLADNFFAWIEDQPNVRVSPDVYVLDGPLPGQPPAMWQTWLPGQPPPTFALEVVSQNKKKEYDVNPDKYASLGVQELVIYDPDNDRGTYRGVNVAPLQRFVRQPDGVFDCTDSGVDRVYCKTLDVWLIAGQTGGRPELLVAIDREGTQVVPLLDEEASAERARADGAELKLAAMAERLRALGLDP